MEAVWSSAASGGDFVGRAREMATLDRMVGEGARLVTLLGTGGVGKTRLALEWSRASEGTRQRDGAPLLFCDLGDARGVDAACAALARVLGVPLTADGTADEAVTQVGSALGEHGRAILVLDNLEQLAAVASALIDPWLALAPRVQIVATSRERLRLRDERCLPVEPLGVPPLGEASLGAIAASDAVALFVARTRKVRADFTLGDADAPAVAAVVRALEGIPLAIELCAARMGILGPSQILPRLSRRLDLLVQSARDAPSRHATLRAALAWSWDLLDPAEKAALAQCSVFRGGFSLEAAERVLDLGDGAPAVLDALQALHDKSLLVVSSPAYAPGERRYGLLESVRELAAEKLAELAGERAAVARHAAFFVGAAGTPLPHPRDTRRLADEADNLDAVCERALASTPIGAGEADVALRALLVLEPLFLASAKGRLEPYVASLDAALAAASPPLDAAVAARARYTRALADFLRGRVVACFLGFQRALEEARAAGDRQSEGLALTKLALLLGHGDRPEESLRCFEEARAIVRRASDPELESDFLLTRGGSLIWQGRPDEAAWHLERAIDTIGPWGDPRARSMAALLLAVARLDQGLYDEGEAASDLALATLQDLEEQRIEGYALGVRGRFDQVRGRLDEARAAVASALRIHEAVGDAWSVGVHRGYLGNLAFEERRFADARDAYRDAVARLRGAGERHYTAIFLSAQGAAELALGAPAAAQACFADAAATLPGVRVHATFVTVDLFRAFEDVHAATAAADLPARERCLATAAATIARAEAPAPDGSPPAARSSHDVCFAARMLSRAIDEARAPAAVPPVPDAPLRPEPRFAPTQGALVVGPEARWFRIDHREPVSLFKARAARLILAKLVRTRVEAPGTALPLDALVEAGWPGERIARKAAANRVYVTLSKLKSLGLRGLIQSRDDGFLLDPAGVVIEALGIDG